jgi:hypothetical protein
VAWAERQAVWYQMRHDGIRRRNKPWPWAADLHYALVDEKIDKLVPFYKQQWFSTERFVDFVSKDLMQQDAATKCAYWYDYKVKQCSNLEDELDIMINYMLAYGHGLLKVTWDTENKCLQYDAIDPLYLIVPSEVCYLQDADRVVHVKHLSKWKYLHGGYGYNVDPDFVKRIAGNRASKEEGSKKDRERRTEGINTTSDPYTIILWEVYERQKDGNYLIHTVSPLCPDEDVKKPYALQYKNGEYGEPELPIVHFWFDRTEKGYYSVRGVSEILSAHESSMNRMWNEKHDCMTLYNRPMLAATKDFPNMANIKCVPGSILPFAVQPIQMGAPPISFDQEMANTRLVAEQRIAIPDFTMGSRVQGAQQGSTPRSATEIHAVMGQQGSVVDARARSHRKQASRLHRQGWQLLVQYDKDLSFVKDGMYYQVDPKVKDEIVSIRPNGSSDSWNLQLRMTKCLQRFQLYKGDPFINQSELRKTCLELDEPGLVARLYQDPNQQQQDQAQKQMEEMPPLELGFPISTDPTDDDQAHIGVILQFLVRNAQIQKPPLDPAGPTMISQHLNSHMQQLRARDPKVFGQMNNMLLHITSKLNPQSVRGPNQPPDENVAMGGPQLQQPMNGQPGAGGGPPEMAGVQ